MLGVALRQTWPADPFEPVPIVVGSRGMETWLRHRLATDLGGLAGAEFVFPGPAFDAAIRWILSPSGRPFWEHAAGRVDPWKGAALTMRVLTKIRARQGDASFERVRRYLGPTGGAVRARELGFAEQVTRTLGQLLENRPDDVNAWLDGRRAPEPEHAWLGALLTDLHSEIEEPSPAQLLAQLEAAPPSAARKTLTVFGLSTLSVGAKRRVAALARHLDLHVFALAPSAEWWADIHSRGEVRAALARAGSDEVKRSLLEQLDKQNAILSSLGLPSRDLQLWMEELSYAAPIEPAPLPPPSSLLTSVQGWVDAAGEAPAPDARPWSAHAGDGSIEVHACHGALRQCEALRDELLRRFAADPTLDPREVLVMTLDVATYAPLIAAVFSRADGAPAIPVHIADLGLRATNPVADALLQALAFGEERVTASRLLELLAIAPVRARLGLSEDDVADVRAMVADSGIRWAWDAADRARHDQPHLDQNTVRFGLERLGLGVMMPTPEGLGVVKAQGGELGPALPLELSTRDRVARFGKLAELCDTLQEASLEARRPATMREWRLRLGALLDALTRVEGPELGLRKQVDARLAELLQGEEATTLELAAILARLAEAFEVPRQGERPITGAVTVCALEPMRSVPFRVIAVVGLDDGVFPRASRPPSWDPFAAPRHGEYDRRTADRHLFLETLLCARDALLLFGTGFGPKRGERLPLSVVVSELGEVVARGTGASSPEDALILHPLQPWSARAFADPARAPFDSLWARARAALDAAKDAGLGATPEDAVMPEEENLTKRSPRQLARALCNAPQELLEGRLALKLREEDGAPLDREPLEPNKLDDWKVRDRVMRALVEDPGVDRDALEARLRAEGTLPLSHAGRGALDRCVADATEAIGQARALGGDRVELDPVAFEHDGLTLGAAVVDARRIDGALVFVWTTASKEAKEKLLLEAWLTLLVARAEGLDVERAILVGFQHTHELSAPNEAEAREWLAELIGLFRRSRTGPTLLVPKLSKAIVEASTKRPDLPLDDLVRAKQGKWDGDSDYGEGALEDAWVHALFGHLTIDDLADRAADVFDLASAVWAPLLARLTQATRAPLGSTEDA